MSVCLQIDTIVRKEVLRSEGKDTRRQIYMAEAIVLEEYPDLMFDFNVLDVNLGGMYHVVKKPNRCNTGDKDAEDS